MALRLYKNKMYTVENINSIPLNLESTAIKEDDKTVAFCSRFNPLSNLYPHRMEVDGKMYASNEHFYQSKIGRAHV